MSEQTQPSTGPVEHAASDRSTDRPRRVLIAEDEALVRLDLAEMLAELGYEVVAQAPNGEEAVRLAGELQPDLAVLDVKMPRLDGISAAEQIVTARICPVVMLTAFSQQDLVARASNAGAMAYLVKPFTKSDLAPTIEVALSRHAQLAALESEVDDLTERLAARKAVDRAKAELQQRYGLDEPAAFRWIQKTAMDMRVSMRRVAELVLDESAGAAAGGASGGSPTAGAGPDRHSPDAGSD